MADWCKSLQFWGPEFSHGGIILRSVFMEYWDPVLSANGSTGKGRAMMPYSRELAFHRQKNATALRTVIHM